jgi:glycogen synthase
MRDEVVRLFDLDGGQVAVVPNGIDAPAWRSSARARATARARFAGEGLLLGVAGRLVHEKGVQTAMAALPRLRRSFPGTRLVVAGTGPLEDDLRAQARSLGPAVHWAGFVPQPRLAALLGAADAVLVPSVYEPFGLIALEAAAAGAPLVVADTGGLRELVEPGVSGLRFTPDDPGTLAAAVTGLLADRPGARRMANRARQRFGRDYSWAAVAERTADIYARAAGTAPDSGRMRIALP